MPPEGAADALLDALSIVEKIHLPTIVKSIAASTVPDDLFFATIALFPNDGPILHGTIEVLRLTTLPLPATLVLRGAALGFATLGGASRQWQCGPH